MAKRGKRVYRTQAKSTRTGRKEKLKYFIYLKIVSESNIHKVEEPEALMFVNCPRQASVWKSREVAAHRWRKESEHRYTDQPSNQSSELRHFLPRWNDWVPRKAPFTQDFPPKESKNSWMSVGLSLHSGMVPKGLTSFLTQPEYQDDWHGWMPERKEERPWTLLITPQIPPWNLVCGPFLSHSCPRCCRYLTSHLHAGFLSMPL